MQDKADVVPLPQSERGGDPFFAHITCSAGQECFAAPTGIADGAAR